MKSRVGGLLDGMNSGYETDMKRPEQLKLGKKLAEILQPRTVTAGELELKLMLHFNFLV